MKRFLKDCWNYLAKTLMSEDVIAFWIAVGVLGLVLLVFFIMEL